MKHTKLGRAGRPLGGVAVEKLLASLDGKPRKRTHRIEFLEVDEVQVENWGEDPQNVKVFPFEAFFWGLAGKTVGFCQADLGLNLGVVGVPQWDRVWGGFGYMYIYKDIYSVIYLDIYIYLDICIYLDIYLNF